MIESSDCVKAENKTYYTWSKNAFWDFANYRHSDKTSALGWKSKGLKID